MDHDRRSNASNSTNSSLIHCPPPPSSIGTTTTTTTSSAPTMTNHQQQQKQRNKEKRAQQNREAQRAFRERKEKYIKSLESRVEELKSVCQQTSALEQHVQSLEKEVTQLSHERELWLQERECMLKERQTGLNQLEELQLDMRTLKIENKRLREITLGLWEDVRSRVSRNGGTVPGGGPGVIGAAGYVKGRSSPMAVASLLQQAPLPIPIDDDDVRGNDELRGIDDAPISASTTSSFGVGGMTGGITNNNGVLTLTPEFFNNEVKMETDDSLNTNRSPGSPPILLQPHPLKAEHDFRPPAPHLTSHRHQQHQHQQQQHRQTSPSTYHHQPQHQYELVEDHHHMR
ncbi:hypothetical protein HK102_007734, partial [Quaeritorhiza haematococci]